MPLGDFAPTLRRRVVVTGIGLLTPLGVDTASTWRGLCQGQSATHLLQHVPFFLPPHIAQDRGLSDNEKQHRLAQIVEALPCKVAAAVCPEDAYRYAPTAHAPRSLRFCADAVDAALRDAALLDDTNPPASPHNNNNNNTNNNSKSSNKTASSQLLLQDRTRVGVQIGVGIPSVADVTDASIGLLGAIGTVEAGGNESESESERGKRGGGGGVGAGYRRLPPFFLPKILGNAASGAMAVRYGLTGPIGSSVAACATGAACVGEAAAWVREGRAEVMICGATEACLTPVAVAGFARMRALCQRFQTCPTRASRPFDRDRGGFIMGEGAGILILEELQHARARGAPRVYGELRGYGVACDAYDAVAPHPDGAGAQRSLEEALRDGGNVPASQVHYVNAHATGTIGDTIELGAIARVFCAAGLSRPASATTREGPLYVSSSKGAFGHLLGAAGSVEAGLALLALHHQLAPPNVNLDQPCMTEEEQREKGLCLVQCKQPSGGTDGTADGSSAVKMKNCEAVVSNSFGFGGINTALLFTQV